MSDQIRLALASHDLDTFGTLPSDDLRWGDDDNPRKCRTRSDVLDTLARGLSDGADAEITEVVTGTEGILCRLNVQWPKDNGRRRNRRLYHVYLVRDGRIYEIRRYDDRSSAAEAAGAADAGAS